MALTKTKVMGKTLQTNNWNVPQQYGTWKANPKKSDNDLVWWVLINLVITFFVVMILFENVFIESIAWLLDFLTFKFVAQFLLLLVVLALDLAIIFVTKNINVFNGGFIAVMIYYALDYYYLSKELIDYSLLNMDFL